MKLTDSSGGNYEQPPVGSHVARCIRMLALLIAEDHLLDDLLRPERVYGTPPIPSEWACFRRNP